MDAHGHPLPAPPSYPGGTTPTHTHTPLFPIPGGHVVTAPSNGGPHVGGVYYTPPPGGTHGPGTHFNLDQLLEIVQSFRLDTTHALCGGQTDPLTAEGKVGFFLAHLFNHFVYMLVLIIHKSIAGNELNFFNQAIKLRISRYNINND